MPCKWRTRKRKREAQKPDSRQFNMKIMPFLSFESKCACIKIMCAKLLPRYTTNPPTFNALFHSLFIYLVHFSFFVAIHFTQSIFIPHFYVRTGWRLFFLFIKIILPTGFTIPGINFGWNCYILLNRINFSFMTIATSKQLYSTFQMDLASFFRIQFIKFLAGLLSTKTYTAKIYTCIKKSISTSNFQYKTIN